MRLLAGSGSCGDGVADLARRRGPAHVARARAVPAHVFERAHEPGGCIRLTHAFASELWGMTRMGVRVIVTPDDAQPVDIAHAKLFVPNMTPVPAATTEAEQIKPSLVAMVGDKTAEVSAAPKSEILISVSFASRMLAGLMSRWIRPR